MREMESAVGFSLPVTQKCRNTVFDAG